MLVSSSKDETKKVFFKLHISGTDSISRAQIKFSIGIMIQLSMHFTNNDLPIVPILVSLAEMEKLGLYVNKLSNSLIR